MENLRAAKMVNTICVKYMTNKNDRHFLLVPVSVMKLSFKFKMFFVVANNTFFLADVY